uniref:Olfactory receptor n=1 Tax=Salvator merianae TaxID=96440 RepID=A0A8D0BPP8_SALMN
MLLSMERGNDTEVTEFVIQGLSQIWELQLFLCALLLLFYAFILPGNVLIIVTIQKDPRLGSPMFFFLANLALLDICYSCITPPKLMINAFVGCKTISYPGCIAQIFFIHLLGAAEMFLLIAMAIDRYVAICYPLYYASVMTKVVCWALLASSWIGGFMHSIIQVILIIPLPFCGPNELDNFFCDITQIIKIACTNTYTLEIVMFVSSGLVSTACFILLLISYGSLLVKLRAPSEGNTKAISTCTSHLIVVIMYFGPCVFIYLSPFSRFGIEKVLSIFYICITPFLNPTIYSLKNKEMKAALKKILSRHSGRVCH